MNKRRLIVLVLLVAILIASVIPAVAQEPTFGKPGKPKVAVVVKTLTGDVYMLVMSEAARDRAKALGAEAEIYQAGGQTNVQQEVSIVEDLIQKKVDIILISPLDRKAEVSNFEDAKAQGIIVVLMDQGSDGGDYATLVATDNYKAGSIGADHVRKIMNDKGNVLVVEGAPGSEAGDNRVAGFKDNVVKGGIKIVGSQSGFWQDEKAMKATENMLQAHPEAELIYCASDVMVGGVLQGIKSVGKEGQIKVVSFDGSSFGIQLLKEGKIIADIAQYPIKEGILAADIGLGLWHGTIDPFALPKYIDTGTGLVTTENAEEALKLAY